jgi:hypothetical protein
VVLYCLERAIFCSCVILTCCFDNCFKLGFILTWGLEILYLYFLPSILWVCTVDVGGLVYLPSGVYLNESPCSKKKYNLNPVNYRSGHANVPTLG